MAFLSGAPLARLRGGLAVLWLYLAAVGAAHGQPRLPSEYEIKAVFLYNFVHFVDWPPRALPPPGEPFCIGVLGDDPFGGSLDEVVRGERVDGHPVVVRRYASARDAQNCQMLFVSRSESAALGEILRELRGRSILLVSDADDFAARGGMIQFFMRNHKVRLRINIAAARAADLAISSKLLRPSEVLGAERS